MKTLILITEKSEAGTWPLDLVDRLGRTHWTDATRKVAEAGDEWLAVDRADDVREDYDAEELAWLSRSVRDPAFFGIEANAKAFLERYILAIPEGRAVLIDNDHGWIAAVGDYKRAITQGMAWLYARSSPLLGEDRAALAAHR